MILCLGTALYKSMRHGVTSCHRLSCTKAVEVAPLRTVVRNNPKEEENEENQIGNRAKPSSPPRCSQYTLENGCNTSGTGRVRVSIPCADIEFRNNTLAGTVICATPHQRSRGISWTSCLGERSERNILQVSLRNSMTSRATLTCTRPVPDITVLKQHSENIWEMMTKGSSGFGFGSPQFSSSIGSLHAVVLSGATFHGLQLSEGPWRRNRCKKAPVS